MVDPRIVLTGFKEWGAVIRGVEDGEQLCLLRLASKNEDVFELSNRRFWLIPTYDHQKEEYIQPIYRDHLDESQEQRGEAGNNRVYVSCWVESKSVIKITKNERLNWVTDYTVYSPRCLQHRFQTQPGEAIHMLIVRAYKLSEPRFLQSMPEYSECTAQDGSHWVDLQQRIPLTKDNPAVSDEEFESQKNEIKERFIREGDDQPEPLLF